jgi:hypothetical protein
MAAVAGRGAGSASYEFARVVPIVTAILIALFALFWMKFRA